MLQQALIVGIGGFVGSVMRFLAQKAVVTWLHAPNHYGTLAVNIVGSFIIGVIFSLAQKNQVLSFEWRLFLAVGICGGFTTFSSFSLDNVGLIQHGNYQSAVFYTLLSLIVGVLATFLGIFSVR